MFPWLDNKISNFDHLVMKTTKTSVYEFTQYRSFLQSLTKGDRALTIEQIAQSTNVGSARLMRMVLQGKRNLTVSNLHAVATFLKLSFDERQYFETLVHGNQAELASTKKYYQEVAASLRKKKPQSSSVRTKGLDFLTELYTPAVTLLMHQKKMSESLFIETAKSLGIEINKVKSAFQIALDNGMIKKNEDDELCMTSTHLVLTDTKLYTHAIQEYLERHLKLADQALKTQYDKQGKFFSNTLSLRSDAYDIFVSKLRNFFEEISAFSDRNPGSDIFQINLQAFKLNKD